MTGADIGIFSLIIEALQVHSPPRNKRYRQTETGQIALDLNTATQRLWELPLVNLLSMATP